MILMIKKPSIFWPLMRNLFLCVAMLVSSVSITATASDHDMSHMDHQAMMVQMTDMAMSGDCNADDMDCDSEMQSKTDDVCCQTDDCERACSAVASLMAILADATKFAHHESLSGTDHDAYYISHLGNIPNPPPIA